MSKLDAIGYIVQWAVELSQFDVEYRPRTVIKSQALADFIAEFTLLGLDQEAKYLTISTDGSFVVGLGGICIIMTSPKKDVLKYGVQLQFPTTNNKVEYEAVFASLRIAKALRIKNLKLRIDSKLIVGQMKKE